MNRIDKLHATIEISSKRQIIDMRNRVIHGYDKIDNEIVWGTIVRHLPSLKTEITFLLIKKTTEHTDRLQFKDLQLHNFSTRFWLCPQATRRCCEFVSHSIQQLTNGKAKKT